MKDKYFILKDCGWSERRIRRGERKKGDKKEFTLPPLPCERAHALP
ncbi:MULTISPECIES: hypothetical protein [Klebsiella]|nr:MULTISPECIES: hypothetical protein [Klebsiella]EKW0781707.1 hypothetical protein [Klebsiella michiganensis]ELN3894099.1 hypothetical protein [Klebsiella michiganensis]ELS5413380.1 hypothetical protein [Klebsiella michiganensis]MBG2546817.1 hypothetical protein [Klebsiella michiganensis]MCG8664853.1 hypothetical protein [Klebsiella michiganensis]